MGRSLHPESLWRREACRALSVLVYLAMLGRVQSQLNSQSLLVPTPTTLSHKTFEKSWLFSYIR